MRWKCLRLGLRISLGLSTFYPTNWLSQWIHVKFSRFPSCESFSPRPPYRRHKVFVRSYLARSALWLFILRSVCPFALCPVHPRHLKYIINVQLFTDSGNPHNHFAATKFRFVSISSELPNLLILKALRNDECIVMDKTKNTSPHFYELAICYLVRKYTRDFHFTAYATTRLSYKYITPRWTRVCLSFKNTTVYTHLMQTKNS